MVSPAASPAERRLSDDSVGDDNSPAYSQGPRWAEWLGELKFLPSGYGLSIHAGALKLRRQGCINMTQEGVPLQISHTGIGGSLGSSINVGSRVCSLWGIRWDRMPHSFRRHCKDE